MQNGIDCGPIAISVLLGLISTGCVYDRKDYLVKPRMACVHDIRLQVLETLVNDLPEIYNTYLRHKTVLGNSAMVTDTIVNIFSQGIERYCNTYAIRRGLEDARRTCVVCSRTAQREHEEEEDVNSDSDLLDKKLQEEDWADDLTAGTLCELRKMFPALKNARQRAKVIKLPPRVRGLPTVPLEDTAFELVPRNRFMDFDDYFDGPTLEEQRKFYADEGYDAAPIYPDHQPTFRD